MNTLYNKDNDAYYPQLGLGITCQELAMAQANHAPIPPPSGHSAVRINIAGTRFAIVKQVAELMQMQVVEDEDNADCDIYWIDAAVPLEKYMQLKPYQIINHFSGMGEICRKDSLARNIQKMKRIRKDEYNILPMTWTMPSEYNALIHFMKELKKRRRTKTFIIKPPNGAMGNGISLTQSVDQIPQSMNVIVQEYIEKPMLLDGFKFDLRVYVLVTSCDPLRIFMYKDGLVRLSTHEYKPPSETNLDQLYMHLTNYSINKHSKTFDKDEDFDKGSKRSLKYFCSWLMKNGYNVSELWAQMQDLVIKTLIVAQPHLRHSYQACRPGTSSQDKCQCFEILGFDIILDEDLKPWLLEVNRSPSFGIDSQLDVQVKTGVLVDAMRLMNIRPSERIRKIGLQRAASRRRLLQTSKGCRPPLDFIGEYEDAKLLIEQKREEVRTRLSHIRKNKELQSFEEINMGDYVRIYPSSDPLRHMVYDKLIGDAASVSFAGRGCSRQGSIVKGIEKMREQELIDLLSQYEAEDSTVPSWHKDTSVPRYASLRLMQPLAFYESSPMEAEYKAMAAREFEEEQTQRIMLALNGLSCSYPGKTTDDVTSAVNKIKLEWKHYQSKIYSFWFVSLDSVKRKQLLTPLRDRLKRLIQTYWRTSAVDTIKLNTIFNRLFNFILGNQGQGLWSTIPNTTEEHWEKQFKKKVEVLSISELQCCRKVVDLCQSTLFAAYYYNSDGQLKGLAGKSKSVIPLQKRLSCDLSRRPTTVLSKTRKHSLVQSYSLHETNKKSKSVPTISYNDINTIHSFPKLSSHPQE